MRNIDRFKNVEFVAGILYKKCLFDDETCTNSSLRVDGNCPVAHKYEDEFGAEEEDCRKCINAWLESEVKE